MAKKENKVIYSNPGTKTVNRYARINDDNGVPVLVVKEKFDLYSDIQSYKDDNDIYKILARVSGDISKLDFNKGVYMDVTKLPDNYNDLMNMSSQIKSDFDSLPVKYKEKLGSNFNVFYGLAMQGKVKDFINAVDSDVDKDIKNVVKNVDFNYQTPIKDNTVKDSKEVSNA